MRSLHERCWFLSCFAICSRSRCFCRLVAFSCRYFGRCLFSSCRAICSRSHHCSILWRLACCTRNADSLQIAWVRVSPHLIHGVLKALPGIFQVALGKEPEDPTSLLALDCILTERSQRVAMAPKCLNAADCWGSHRALVAHKESGWLDNSEAQV